MSAAVTAVSAVAAVAAEAAVAMWVRAPACATPWCSTTVGGSEASLSSPACGWCGRVGGVVGTVGGRVGGWVGG